VVATQEAVAVLVVEVLGNMVAKLATLVVQEL